MARNEILILERLIRNIMERDHNLLFGIQDFLYGKAEDRAYDLVFDSRIDKDLKGLVVPEMIVIPVFSYPEKKDNIGAMYSLNREMPQTSLFAVKSNPIEFYSAIPNKQGVEISRETRYHTVKEEDLLRRALEDGNKEFIEELCVRRARINRFYQRD